METITTISDVLNTGGFVAVCAVLMWYIKYITDQHNSEIDDLKAVITKGIVVLQRVLDKLDINEDITDTKEE